MTQTPRGTADDPVQLLWTGGWDSTFRLLTLLVLEQRRVQPYYVLDDERRRRSVSAEREAMRRIREALGRSHSEAAARLAPAQPRVPVRRSPRRRSRGLNGPA